MISEFASLASLLERYKPKAAPVDAYTNRRRKQIADSMARLRARRKAAGLNNRGGPIKPNLGRPRSKILPSSKARFAKNSTGVKPGQVKT